MTSLSEAFPHPSAIPRVLFLNDVGFQYGAGVAQARQILSFMKFGAEVGALAWSHGDIQLEDVSTENVDLNLWLGIRSINYLEGGQKLSDESIIAGIILEIAQFNPRVILVGNLHAAKWPFELLTRLKQLGYRVISYLHDAYLFTGRCAYPGDCSLYLTGCNETCPTANEYPVLPLDQIADAWRLRRQTFGGPEGVEVIANSLWNKQMFKAAIPACEHVETIYLGADDLVFKPGDKRRAREALKLPQDIPIILCAAVNFQEKRKGGHFLQAIIEALGARVKFIAFGHNAGEIPGLTGMGYHLQGGALAQIYQAADIFLGTATEEAFGQTILEAQLSGLPVVAFQTGGVDEIVRNEITGKLVRNGDVEGAVAAINAILNDELFRTTSGSWAHLSAARRYSLRKQAESWTLFFTDQTPTVAGSVAPTVAYPGRENDMRFAHRPSWAGVHGFINEEHAGIFDRTSHVPGWQMTGDSFKLYEAGYFAGDVILEIGTYGGRSACVELRGALANPARKVAPKFYGIDISPDSIARTRQTLADESLIDHCHLFEGTLQSFVKRWKITPTMVFLDGDHRYAGVVADLKLLSAYLPKGTPLLVHDYANPENGSESLGVRQAADEWEKAGHGRFMGCFGCTALYLIN